MRVTKKLTARFSYLNFLTRFLNFDFRSADAREIKKFFRDSLIEARFPPNQKAKRLQTKLKQELLPIIPPKDRPDRRKAEERLSRLVAMVNKIVPRPTNPTWSVEFIDERDLKYKPRPDEKVKQFPVPPLLKILGGTWYVSKMANLYHRGPLEHFLWWTVINAMENGELAKLKTCGLCEKFFLQDDARQEFCTDKCRYDFHNRTRQEQGYFGRKRKQTRDLMLKRAKALLDKGRSPTAVSAKTKLSLNVLRREGLLK